VRRTLGIRWTGEAAGKAAKKVGAAMLQRIGIRTRFIAAAAALAIGLGACEGLIAETCGPEPQFGTSEHFNWRDCKDAHVIMGVGLIAVILAALATGAAIAASDGGGGNGDSGGPPVGV
jgi:hypothetical protein